jgi:mRNA interferase MazF
MHKGKIILVPFPFTDLSGHKVRPALVLHSGRGEDFIACFISSKQNAKVGSLDIQIKPDTRNGLKVDSVIKIAKMATLEKRIALGEIGSLDEATLRAIDKKLKATFSL